MRATARLSALGPASRYVRAAGRFLADTADAPKPVMNAPFVDSVGSGRFNDVGFSATFYAVRLVARAAICGRFGHQLLIMPRDRLLARADY